MGLGGTMHAGYLGTSPVGWAGTDLCESQTACCAGAPVPSQSGMQDRDIELVLFLVTSTTTEQQEPHPVHVSHSPTYIQPLFNPGSGLHSHLCPRDLATSVQTHLVFCFSPTHPNGQGSWVQTCT